MLNVKISIDDGNGKKAEIEISEADNLSKLVIIDKVFTLFGIDTDIMEMAKTYQRIGEAYSEFFTQMEPVEPKAIETIDKKLDIKQQMIDAFTKNKDELENTYKETSDQPEFLFTGIKIREDGSKNYCCHYKCDVCGNKGNHYVFETSKRTYCHSCDHQMMIFPAHPDGFPNRDTKGNFFRAGDYKDWNIEWKIGD